jgi:hypothetical protein
MESYQSREHCCCPSCKQKNGIIENDSIVKCKFCDWTGKVNELLCDSEDYEYHDHEPGID